ncbi:unnamed protein product [Nezara viridula]|uniref:Neuropeptide n=1 Tax=Nezara viridula TaxID=85310 RepID=A0A9P0HMC2_NEZVI|nr:unnamed protein product [Nezara viridula]
MLPSTLAVFWAIVFIAVSVNAKVMRIEDVHKNQPGMDPEPSMIQVPKVVKPVVCPKGYRKVTIAGRSTCKAVFN